MRVELRRSLPNTIENFGKDAQYGTPDLSWYGGTNISAVQPNPEVSGSCASAVAASQE